MFWYSTINHYIIDGNAVFYYNTADNEVEEDDLFSEFLTNPTAVAAAAAIAGPLALAAVVPPPLPMFPPQGLPQPNAGSVPGAGGGGGGSLPSAALTVRDL